jgi:hypothetical protein
MNIFQNNIKMLLLRHLFLLVVIIACIKTGRANNDADMPDNNRTTTKTQENIRGVLLDVILHTKVDCVLGNRYQYVLYIIVCFIHIL